LTTTELLTHIEERWGREAIGELAPVVERAEWVKFGLHRPDADVAEADLERTAAWIGAASEAR
jgi:hypothetical protein